MERTEPTQTGTGFDLSRKIRVEWAMRQYSKGLMDMQEAALAARVPVTSFAAAVELGVPRLAAFAANGR